MAQARAQGGTHPALLQQLQDDPQAAARQSAKRPDEPEIAGLPIWSLRPSVPPKFAVMSVTRDLSQPTALPVKAVSPLSAPPVRLHAEWAAQGVMLWLGADAGAKLSTPQLPKQIRLWLSEHGV